MSDTVRHYTSWAQVPAGYMTKTQLLELDLPRRPGPVRATVEAYNWRGKRQTFDLFRVAESTPSPASARQLAARRTDGTPNPHLCSDCGAHPEQPATVYQDGRRLCRACQHIYALRVLQEDYARRAAYVSRGAAELLRVPLAVVHCELAERGTTASGSPRSPAAVRAEAVDEAGAGLLDVTVRLVGPRSKGIPEGAQAVDDVGQRIRDAFAGRRLLVWSGEGFNLLSGALRAAGWTDAIPTGYGAVRDLEDMAMHWRADFDHATRAPRRPVPPGRADRMLYLLQQIGADAPDAEDQAGGQQ